MDQTIEMDMIDDEAAGYDAAEDFDLLGQSDFVSDRVIGQRRGDEIAAQYAVLGAIAAGVKAIQARVAAELVSLYRDSGLVKGSHDTPLGSVAMRETPAKASIVIDDEEAFTAHMAATDPDSVETITRIKPDYRKAALGLRLQIVNDQVVDTSTGAKVAFASVDSTPAGDPTPTYSSGATQQAAKMRATEWVDAQMTQLQTAIAGGV